MTVEFSACPDCGSDELFVWETFNTFDGTIACRVCSWARMPAEKNPMSTLPHVGDVVEPSNFGGPYCNLDTKICY
eukprot:g46510.t1